MKIKSHFNGELVFIDLPISASTIVNVVILNHTDKIKRIAATEYHGLGIITLTLEGDKSNILDLIRELRSLPEMVEDELKEMALFLGGYDELLKVVTSLKEGHEIAQAELHYTN